MALRIYGRGFSPNGVEYTANIYDADWSGASTLVDLARDGIRIDYQADGSKESDPHWPIFGSICTIDILANISSSTLTTFFDDLRTSKEGRFFVEITANAGNYDVLWRGIVTPDTLTNETDQAPIYQVSVTAVCGLALLKTVPYYNAGTLYSSGTESLISHLSRALTKLAHTSTFWDASADFIETSLDWWAVGMTRGGANDPLDISRVDHAAFYDYFTKGSVDDDVISCYDVIRHICQSFGCRILMRGGMWIVEQIDYRANSTYEYRRYTKAATATTNGSHTGVTTLNQVITTGVKISYVQYDYIPQLTKARVVYESRLRRNFWGNIILAESTTFDFDQEISSNSGAVTFRLRGVFFINIKNNTYSGNPQDVIIPEMRMYLKLGGRYLKRTVTFSNFAAHYSDMEWTTSSADRCAIVASGQQVPASGLSKQFVQGFDFITPPLPADASDNQVSATFFQIKKNDGSDVDESQFTITWSAGSMWMEVYDQGTPDVQEDEILYEATNPDGGTDVWETNVRIGAGGSPNSAGRLTNSSGTELSLWGQGTGTRDKALGQIHSKRVVDGRLRPKKRLSGDLIANNIDPRKLIETSDSIQWLSQKLSWRPTEDILTGTWLESDYGTTGSPATPIKVKVLGGPKTPTIIGPITPTPTTGGGNQGFASNNPPAVLQPLAFNTLATAITKGASVTSIAVNAALAGNEFLVGDDIIAVHPVSGQYQAFSVSSAPGPGATSISVTAENADFDVPQFAGLFVQQKAYAFSLPPGTHEGSILRWDDVNEVWEPYDGVTDGHVLTWDTTNGWQAEASGGGGLADGDKGDITVTSSGAVWTIDNNVVTFSKFQQIATDRLLGRDAAGTGNVTTISLDTTLEFTGGDVIRRAALTGDVTATAGSNATTIANNAVTDGKLRDSAALSVIGRATNTAGDPADIAAGTDAHVLRRSGTTLAFGQVATGGIANNAVTNALIRDSAALSVIGRATNTAGDPADIAAGTDGFVLRRSGTTLGFGTVATAGIADDAVTLAKLQNAVANNIVLGNVAGVGQPYVELTAAQLQTLLAFVDGTGATGQVAYWSGPNSITGSARNTWDNGNGRLTIIPQIAGLGAGLAGVNINPVSMGSMEALRAWGNIAGNMVAIFHNTSTASGSSTIIQIVSGGTAAGDPILQFTVSGGAGTVAAGLDNSDGDKFKITPNSATPGGTANSGIIITQDAVPLVGINLDAPAWPLDVDGKVKSHKGFMGKFAQWQSANIVFGNGAGTGPVLNSVAGTDNALYVSFTTGTSPTANGTIFTGNYPNAWNSSSWVTFSAEDADAATNITLFRVSGRTAAKFDFIANGTLAASTNYQFCFTIFGA